MAHLLSMLQPYVATYGALALGALLLLGALGVPMPGTFYVIAGGTLIQQGVLELYSTTLIALTAVVIGDLLCYSLGRALRRPVVARWGASARWRRAEDYFNQRGGLSIYLSRCMLVPLATPINLVAGSTAYPVCRFARMDALGQLTWILLYGTLGYLFGSQAQHLEVLTRHLSIVLLLVGLCVLVYGLLRRRSAATRHARLLARRRHLM
jgi:membrane-associated protein